jgi:hypothetical protein
MKHVISQPYLAEGVSLLEISFCLIYKCGAVSSQRTAIGSYQKRGLTGKTLSTP